jgi:hypothetical protein
MFEIRRLPRVVALLVSSLLVLTCESRNAATGGSPSAAAPSRASNPCSGGKGHASPNKPVVCVDDRTTSLSVHPDPVIVHDVSASDRNPVMIQWMTVTGGNVRVVMREGCTTDMKCTGGKCTAKTIPHKAAETGERRCKYDIITDRATLDPDTVIVKCCTVPEPAP